MHQFQHPRHQLRLIVLGLPRVPLRAPRLIDHFAGPTLTRVELLLQVLDRLALAGGAY
jgi:hypothetical protein